MHCTNGREPFCGYAVPSLVVFDSCAQPVRVMSSDMGLGGGGRGSGGGHQGGEGKCGNRIFLVFTENIKH